MPCHPRRRRHSATKYWEQSVRSGQLVKPNDAERWPRRGTSGARGARTLTGAASPILNQSAPDRVQTAADISSSQILQGWPATALRAISCGRPSAPLRIAGVAFCPRNRKVTPGHSWKVDQSKVTMLNENFAASVAWTCLVLAGCGQFAELPDAGLCGVAEPRAERPHAGGQALETIQES